MPICPFGRSWLGGHRLRATSPTSVRDTSSEGNDMNARNKELFHTFSNMCFDICRCRGTEGSRKAIIASFTQNAQTHSRTQHQSGQLERPHGFTALASYRFKTQDLPCRWLEACVREAVAHIDEAPFLQVTHTHSATRSGQPSFERQALQSSPSLASRVRYILTSNCPQLPAHHVSISTIRARHGSCMVCC